MEQNLECILIMNAQGIVWLECMGLYREGLYGHMVIRIIESTS